jgi:tRNA dimethylallyltransferase
MNLGTAKPSREELDSVRHHFINSLSIEESYDVRKFEEDALKVLDKLFQKHETIIMTGGSGLFADAVVDG